MATTLESLGSSNQTLFTCLSCSIAFHSAEEQRIHYRSDHHRYNMKRRVASLPPISASVFNQKVLERQEETNIKNSSRELPKQVTTDKSHINLKEGENQMIDEKIAAARSRLSPIHCLFCSNVAGSLADNLTHMSTTHSFFIPDAEYLIDIAGLITYLGEKIAVGNVCIYCNEKSREFKTLDAVRKHMVDKSHCKIAYDSETDRLEVSDYYDFSSSYPDAEQKRKRCEVRGQGDDIVGNEWEDVDDDEGQVDEVIEELLVEEDADSDTLPDNQITYGDSHLELVLPSGVRIGHRSMRRYYAQTFGVPRGGKGEDPNSGASLVQRLLADKNSALIPRKGGFGAFGSGTEVVKARNRGEAREAGRHVREFRDQRRREDFKTKVGFIANFQKHYRDPLLQ